MSRGFLHKFSPVVVVGDQANINLLETLCGGTTVVCTIDSMTDALVCTNAATADLCFVDGMLNATICEWISGVGINLIITMTHPRRIHSSWIRTMVPLIHSDLGGVTNYEGKCYLFSREHLSIASLDTFKHHRDAYTIIDDSIWCTVKRRRPHTPAAHPLRVINIGSNTKPVYHIHGLLPIDEVLQCVIVTPGIGLGINTWGIRRVTQGEVLCALDMSHDLIPTGFSLSMLRDTTLIPARIWEVAGCVAMNTATSGALDRSRHPPKRLRVDLFHPAPLGVAHDELFSNLQLQSIAQSAVKSDDAMVNTKIWLQHFLDEGGLLEGGRFLSSLPSDSTVMNRSMDVLRQMCLVWWKRQLLSEYRRYLLERFEPWRKYSRRLSAAMVVLCHNGRYVWTPSGHTLYKEWWQNRILLTHSEWMKGCDALLRALRSSWWEWEDGSAPFYWRWPKWYQGHIRDGISFPFSRPAPRYMQPQRSVNDTRRRQLIINKLSKVLERRYMGAGMVKSLTAFFDVPKGKDDIRMVYDGTVNGFNDSIEVPSFGLPTVRSHLRSMDPKYHMVDADVGECFLNFHLHQTLQPYVGVDLTSFIPSGNKGQHWVRWYRAGMGLKSSPYQACQAMMVLEEVIRGDRTQPNNPFRWDEVVENLPGSDNYDPRKPWVYKIRLDDGHIACDIFIYVDDLRITGWSRSEAWKACCRATSILGHLGVQDAPRKRRDASNMAGAWAGSVVYATETQVLVLVTEEKWCKAKSQVQELKHIIQHKVWKRKRLQEIRGFLNYIAATYPLLTSYLMGLHLTIDGWRKKRHSDGWRKLRQDPTYDEDDSETTDEFIIMEDGPEEVEIKPRLIGDVNALDILISGDKPPLRRIRSIKVTEVLYGFGDASGSAFGATLGTKSEVFFEYGQWCHEDSEESSNWRELRNLVDSIEGWIQTHDLSESQLFIFTDNTTAESAFWKGTSRSRKLCDLILRLKCIAMRGDLDLHVIHVSGRRMQQQGTDGLSRGDQSMGVMKGTPMNMFVPLHLSPTERDSGLKDWIDGLVEGWNFKWLKTSEWFEDHHAEGSFIWDIPPGAGDLAYEMLDKARLKRPSSMHILLIPRLFTGLWRRLLTRRSDCYIRIDWDDVWNLKTHFEPLLLFICIPFKIDSNFEARRSFLLEKFQGTLQECRVSTSTGKQQGHLLRKFLQLARNVPSV